MPGDDLLKKLSQDLTVREKTSLHLREGLATIFNNLLSEKMVDEKPKAKLYLENILVLRTSRACEH